jgi:hypothetical protein
MIRSARKKKENEIKCKKHKGINKDTKRRKKLMKKVNE